MYGALASRKAGNDAADPCSASGYRRSPIQPGYGARDDQVHESAATKRGLSPDSVSESSRVERGNAKASFRTVEVGDYGIGQEFGVAGPEFDVLEDEFNDRRQALSDLVPQFLAVGMNDEIERPAPAG